VAKFLQTKKPDDEYRYLSHGIGIFLLGLANQTDPNSPDLPGGQCPRSKNKESQNNYEIKSLFSTK
jgi:hypothetical protein